MLKDLVIYFRHDGYDINLYHTKSRLVPSGVPYHQIKKQSVQCFFRPDAIAEIIPTIPIADIAVNGGREACEEDVPPFTIIQSVFVEGMLYSGYFTVNTTVYVPGMV